MRTLVLTTIWLIPNLASSISLPAEQPVSPWAQIEEIIGAKGLLLPDDVFKIAQPRSDLNVTRGSVRVAPTFALTSWMAFKEVDGGMVVVHGDLCLREEEVNPVMTRLKQGGIETTALHNHISREQPRVMFLHFWGRGEAKPLAETLRGALELAGGIQSPPKPPDDTLNQEELERILGQKAKLTAGVVQFGFPRPFPIRMHGVILPPAMGMATAINFQPAPAGAATTGDFVLREEELAPVLETLRAHNIEVTAVHNHMLNDDPRMVFVHFWGEGKPAELARGLRAALDALEAPRTAHPRETPLRWESQPTPVPPRVDGLVDEVWQRATPLNILVRKAIGGHNPRPVTLRALHTHDTLHILAQWPDATRSDMRDPYVWNPEKNLYERPSKPDDQFAIEFPIEGDFAVSMLTLSHRYVADVWHWKAGRGNPIGWVDDKRHLVGQDPIPGATQYSMGGRGSVYIARLMDAGTPSYAPRAKPESFQGDVVDAFEHGEPTGSLSDVRGKGLHDGKTWTLEMSRKFNTGHEDDAVLDPSREIKCAIAVLDDELYWEHSVSPVINLRFARGPLAPLEGRAANIPSGRRWNFEDSSAGSLPVYVDAPRGQWRVQEVADAPAGSKTLVQVAQSPRPYFNLAVFKGEKARDLRLSVKLKALSGSVDQGGGLVWRYRDPDNYYIARANPLENNLRAYRVVEGKREMLQSADVPVETAKWHTLIVTMQGNRIACELNGRKLLEVADDTFKDPGQFGLWTKADANTAFDELTVEPFAGNGEHR